MDSKGVVLKGFIDEFILYIGVSIVTKRFTGKKTGITLTMIHLPKLEV